MLNKVLKIVLPIMVLATILAVILTAQSAINGMAPSEVNPFDFEDYINNKVKTEIEGKSFEDARTAYWRIYDVIKTEESVEAEQSGMPKKLASTAVVDSCYQNTFAAYWDIFGTSTDHMFKSEWSSRVSEVENIKTEADKLLQSKGTAMAIDSLTNFSAYVDMYNKALNFTKTITCTSKEQYNKKKKEQASYLIYPLTNNKDIKEKLEKVPNRAKELWLKHIKNKVEKTCKINTLDNFLFEKEVCDKKIDEYINQSDLQDEKEKLKNHWRTLLVNEAERLLEKDRIDFYEERDGFKPKINAYLSRYGKDSILENMRNSL